MLANGRNVNMEVSYGVLWRVGLLLPPEHMHIPRENVWEKLFLEKIRLLVIEAAILTASYTVYSQPRCSLLKRWMIKMNQQEHVLKYCNGNETKYSKWAVGAYITWEICPKAEENIEQRLVSQIK